MLLPFLGFGVPCNRRKEMEMLSDQKRGWQGRSGGVVSTTKKPGHEGRKKTPRRTRSSDRDVIGGGAKTVPIRAPNDYSQFQRDWRRRYRTDDERRHYLRVISPDKLPELFRVEMEPDVLGKVVSLVCDEFPAQPIEHRIDSTIPSSSKVDQSGDAVESLGSAATPFCQDKARYCMELLWALTKTGRFAVNILFLEEKEKLALARLLDSITAAVRDDSDEGFGRLKSLRRAYAV